MRRKLLWIGDAVVSSGFARCTHHILEGMKDEWEPHVLGINYPGDPHPYDYPIYPCFTGGDPFGLGRVKEVIERISPEVAIIQNDPWNIPGYMKRTGNLPCIASMPVDGKNCRGSGLNGLAHAIFWSNFGLAEARKGGYTGTASVIPLGVNLDVYKSIDKVEARKHVQLPERIFDKFLVGNINRNQPRKRLDLTVRAFAKWIKSREIRDAYLYLHVAPTGDRGYDCQQLTQYYGIANRLILAEPDIGFGISEIDLVNTYNCFDIQVSTTQGEGWGLTQMEGMACGVPQIVPDWSALGEWAKDVAFVIPCPTTAATFNKINVIGGVADEQALIEAFDGLYQDKELRESFTNKGLEFVKKPEFNWKNIAEEYKKAIDEALSLKAVAV
jgi:glycosyltransferase involved in cell wall biosynthesis